MENFVHCITRDVLDKSLAVDRVHKGQIKWNRNATYLSTHLIRHGIAHTNLAMSLSTLAGIALFFLFLRTVVQKLHILLLYSNDPGIYFTVTLIKFVGKKKVALLILGH